MNSRKQPKIYTLHGWSFSPAVWRNTSFSKGVHLKLPGHEDSPFHSTSIEKLALEIGKLLPENSTLVGWSLGATVFYEVARRFPEKVRKLVLIAPTISFVEVSQPEVVVKRFLKKLKRDFYEGVTFFRKLCKDEELKLPKFNEEEAVKLLESFINFKMEEKLKVKTEVFAGEVDEITKLKGAYKTFKLTGEKLTVFPGKGHLSLLRCV